MRQRKFNSRALRQLALELLQQIAEDDEIPKDERDDFATSLVRQWITYDGSATVFVGEQQVYLVLGKTPLGKPCIVPEPGLHGWMRQLTQDWKVSTDDLPEVIDQLNRGQSAEVVNGDGVPLRLWVNPKERSRGVEPLVKEDFRPGTKRDYCKIAANELEQQLGEGLEPEEMDELACSVAKQWQRHEGHACLFLDGHEQLAFKLNEHGDGTCDVVAKRMSVDLEPALSSLGLPPEALPELIARINLGQEVEFRDKQGAPSVLWHDAKARRICVRKVGPAQPTVPVETPPVLCPKCTAVLSLWQEGERQQTCPLCGDTISRC
jgi:hypothetical protein